MTPDEAGFLRTLAADPADAVARLVYADWLDDRPDPLSNLKADYLRAWCELLDVPVRALDDYTDRAERLEALRARLPADWAAAVGGDRFHLTDPTVVAGRAEAFFLRYGGSEGLLEPRVVAVLSAGAAADWEVRYTTIADNRSLWLHGDTGRVAERLAVERATGRVHMMSPRGQRFLTHHAYPARTPRETVSDGRRS